MMAVQRDIPFPDDNQREQIALYKVWMENHSQSTQSDDHEAEQDECKMIDDLLPEVSDSGDSDNDNASDMSVASGDEQSEESESPQIAKKDAEIERYKSTIKKLRADLAATKRLLN